MIAKILVALTLCLQSIPSLKPIEQKSLMIVAHPDDESIFAGDEIRKQSYMIVCLTNGDHPTRRKEFQQMLKETNNTGIILSFPDKVHGKRSTWSMQQHEIEASIESYISMYPWKKIVTHNPKGEYGHQHHKLTNQMVTTIATQHNLEQKLYYFSYFTHKQKPTYKKQLNKEERQAKQKLLEVYASQKKTVHKFDHFIEYERLVPYRNF
ncbi:hypothetical protein A4S06_09385 [Erysipelotrichaceae bacterium MTC7]|nr:hypothetical protein A4S06_09385 [Erysipelotrichaceae bacterium MTC7]